MFDIDDFVVKLGENISKDLPDFQLEKLDKNVIKLKINKEITLEVLKKTIEFNYDNDIFFEEFVNSNNLLSSGSKFVVINSEKAMIILSCALSLSSEFWVYMR